MPSASSPTPVQQNGILTCIVHIDLSPEMDAPVTVNTAITGPAGYYLTNSSQPVTGATTMTYTSTFMISLQGRNPSENYTCVATLNPTLTNTYIISSSPRAYSIRFVKSGMGTQYKCRYPFVTAFL